MATAFRRGGIVGARGLILVQALACLFVGVLLVASPPANMVAAAAAIGGYWLIRSICTVGHALLVDPHRWAGRGLVAILGLSGAVVTLQAPIAGAFPIGFAIVLFVGFQALVAGSIELVLADRSGSHALAFLALANVAVGLGFVLPTVTGVAVPTIAIGTGVGFAGLLAVYGVIELPTPRRRLRAWSLDG